MRTQPTGSCTVVVLTSFHQQTLAGRPGRWRLISSHHHLASPPHLRSQKGSTSSATMVTLPGQRPLRLNPLIPPPLPFPARLDSMSFFFSQMPSAFSDASPPNTQSSSLFAQLCASVSPTPPHVVAGPFAQCPANPVTSAHPESPHGHAQPPQLFRLLQAFRRLSLARIG